MTDFKPWDRAAYPGGYHTQLNTDARAAAQVTLAEAAAVLGDETERLRRALAEAQAERDVAQRVVDDMNAGCLELERELLETKAALEQMTSQACELRSLWESEQQELRQLQQAWALLSEEARESALEELARREENK